MACLYFKPDSTFRSRLNWSRLVVLARSHKKTHLVHGGPGEGDAPEFLDVGGDPRESVDAVHHAVLLNELCTAPHHLGHCRAGTRSEQPESESDNHSKCKSL